MKKLVQDYSKAALLAGATILGSGCASTDSDFERAERDIPVNTDTTSSPDTKVQVTMRAGVPSSMAVMADAIRNSDYHPMMLLNAFPAQCSSVTKPNGNYVVTPNTFCKAPIARAHRPPLSGEQSLELFMDNHQRSGFQNSSGHFDFEHGSASRSINYQKSYVYNYLMTPSEQQPIDDIYRLRKICEPAYAVNGDIYSYRSGNSISVRTLTKANCDTLIAPFMKVQSQQMLADEDDSGWSLGKAWKNTKRGFGNISNILTESVCNIAAQDCGDAAVWIEENAYCNNTGRYLDATLTSDGKTKFSCSEYPVRAVNYQGKTVYPYDTPNGLTLSPESGSSSSQGSAPSSQPGQSSQPSKGNTASSHEDRLKDIASQTGLRSNKVRAFDNACHAEAKKRGLNLETGVRTDGGQPTIACLRVE